LLSFYTLFSFFSAGLSPLSVLWGFIARLARPLLLHDASLFAVFPDVTALDRTADPSSAYTFNVSPFFCIFFLQRLPFFVFSPSPGGPLNYLRSSSRPGYLDSVRCFKRAEALPEAR